MNFSYFSTLKLTKNSSNRGSVTPSPNNQDMSAREVIETAVNILEDQLTKTSHIARFSDLNKIRKEHHRELIGALMSVEVPGYPVPWSGLVGYQLNLARVIISEHKKSQISRLVQPL